MVGNKVTFKGPAKVNAVMEQFLRMALRNFQFTNGRMWTPSKGFGYDLLQTKTI